MEENNKLYKHECNNNINMLPGDPSGSPDESLVFLDEGFVYKLSKHFGGENPIKFDRIKFAKNLTEKEKLVCKKIFYYNAPPFQSETPTKEEELRKEGYDKFVRSISKNEIIVIREGRCQRLKINGKFIYKQKAVDSLAIIDLMKVPLKYPCIKKIVVISSDSDFVPAVESLREFGIKTILYTYYEKKRDTNFSRSNELIKSVYKYILLTKEDFGNASLSKSKDKKKADI